MNFIAPAIGLTSFTCPYCNTLAQQLWAYAYINNTDSKAYFSDREYASTLSKLAISTCQSCEKHHIWIDGEMISPESTSIPLPNEDMPEEIAAIYLEAREVFSKSPRAAAALLRLALQHLCQHLGGEGRNINDDIGNFVRDGAVDARVQKSLDIVRVTGNNAVHPGQLDIVDNKDIAARLFGLLNFIVDAMITQPQQIEAFFSELPQGARDAIERRDA